MTDRVVGRAGDNVVVLGYAAEGRREGTAPRRCPCTSAYRSDGGVWKLVQHQQTPFGRMHEHDMRRAGPGTTEV